MTKTRALSNKKMANRPLKHLKKSVFSKSARGMIYFWAFSIKGIYMDYQKPSPDLTHWTRPWRQPWPVVKCPHLPLVHLIFFMSLLFSSFTAFSSSSTCSPHHSPHPFQLPFSCSLPHPPPPHPPPVLLLLIFFYSPFSTHLPPILPGSENDICCVKDAAKFRSFKIPS